MHVRFRLHIIDPLLPFFCTTSNGLQSYDTINFTLKEANWALYNHQNPVAFFKVAFACSMMSRNF